MLWTGVRTIKTIKKNVWGGPPPVNGKPEPVNIS